MSSSSSQTPCATEKPGPSRPSSSIWAVSDLPQRVSAHTGVEIGPADGGQLFGRGERHAVSQVVAGRATLEQHLDRAEIGVEIFVLQGLVIEHLAAAGQQKLQRPAVRSALQEVAKAMD